MCTCNRVACYTCSKAALAPQGQTFTAAQLRQHGPVIMEYLAGKKIQYRASSMRNGVWRNAFPTPADPTCRPMFLPNLDYRVKPEPKLTVGYRRYIAWNSVNLGRRKVGVFAMWEGDSDVEGNRFISWIDKEWQYAEIPEGS